MQGNRPVIAIAAIFKNEAPYILEWVAYHRAIGVERFYIADNNSDDGTTDILASLARAGIIVHIPFPHVAGQPPQLPAYAEIMRRHRSEADWFAFIDADEFIFLDNDHSDLPGVVATLALRENVGAIVLNWAIYGSSGHADDDGRLVIERFSGRAKMEWGTNFHYKSLVRSSAWASVHGNPHLFVLSPGYSAFHSNGQPVVDHARGPGLSRDVIWAPVRLNHYVIKSKGEFLRKKRPRGRATIANAVRPESFFDSHDRNDVLDVMTKKRIASTKSELRHLRELLITRGKRRPLDMVLTSVRRRWDNSRFGITASGSPSIVANEEKQKLPSKGPTELAREIEAAGRTFSPADLDETGDLNLLLSKPDHRYLAASGNVVLPSAALIDNSSGMVIRPTGPVFLPLAANGVLPSKIESLPVFVSHLKDAMCYPGGIILQRGRVFTESFRHGINRGSTSLSWEQLDQANDPAIRIEEQPTLFLDGEHFAAFGHFLAEIYSRLWVRKYLQIRDIKVAVGKGASAPFISELLALAGVTSEQLIVVDEPIRFRSLIVPSQSLVVRTGLSPLGAEFYGDISDSVGASIVTESAYISRRLEKRRALENEPNVERLFRKAGFDVLLPELMTMRSQISLFRNARRIAGLSGSNLFGLLFSKQVTDLFVMTGSGYILHNEAVFTAGRDCRSTYFIGSSSGVHANWTADMPRLEQSVGRWLASSQL